MIDLIILYRIGNWCYKKHIPIIPALVRLIMFWGHGSRVPVTVEIGKGTRFTA